MPFSKLWLNFKEVSVFGNIICLLNILLLVICKIYNGILREKFGSAALEEEFKGIKTLTTFKKQVKKFYESNLAKLIDTAHNPLTDSIWALVVAITMILRCN